MSDVLDTLAEDSTYHHDMLYFLNKVGDGPLKLTKTKLLKLQDISDFGDNFKHDIYHRDENGEILFRITTEASVRYLLNIRALARIMYLVYHRKGKLLLSKNGRGFINNISPGIQLTHLFLEFTFELNWEYVYPGDASSILQKNIMYIYQFLIDSDLKSINMKMFSKNLDNYFKISRDDDLDRDYFVRMDIEMSLINELELFGIIQTVRVKRIYDYEVESFSVTRDGELLLGRVFENKWGY